jgi:4-amino-4-deoxy-L-arabinose transferase-like glycosyltransferase
VTTLRHAARIGLLMAGAAALLGWVLIHTEACFADGLRYIHQAEQLDRGDWRGALAAVDHPLHPLLIATTHKLTGGDGPISWERAALAVGFVAAVLLVIPVYFLTHAFLDDDTAWLATMLLVANPMNALLVVNVLSESTFLLFWCFGLWGGLSFLRTGSRRSLVLALISSALAYFTRPEGILLPAALAATVLIPSPLTGPATTERRLWPPALALGIGLIVLIGPYVALKGGLGTKPGIARVMGWARAAEPLALERERPLAPDQNDRETGYLAVLRLHKVLRSAVGTVLYPFSLVGLVMALFARHKPREWIFLAVILGVSAVALMRLFATAGYGTGRHGLVPGMVLTLAAACAIIKLARTIAIPGRWLGAKRERIGPCPSIVSLVVVVAVVVPSLLFAGPRKDGPFAVYHRAADWLRTRTQPQDRVLDLNDWVLFFGERAGYVFAQVYEAAADPTTRWVVVRKPHVDGRNHYSQLLRERIAGRAPVATIPPDAGPHEVQIRIYDCRPPRPEVAITSARAPRPRF